MDDALVVRGGQSVGEAGGDVEESLERHAAFGYRPVERLAFDELHREEVDAVRLLDRVHAHDAGVVEGRESLGLALEALQALRVRGHLGRQHLEGDLAPELRVGGAVDLPHPAGADRGGDAVVRERAADHSRHSGAEDLDAEASARHG